MKIEDHEDKLLDLRRKYANVVSGSLTVIANEKKKQNNNNSFSVVEYIQLGIALQHFDMVSERKIWVSIHKEQ